MASSPSKMNDIELREVPSPSGDSRGDEVALARLGKKAVLKRRFGFLAILGLSCTVLITWEGSVILFLVGYQNGGPAGVIYGYLLVWLGTTSVFVVLSELVSMAPTSGGQYHWVSMLAPRRMRNVLSYISGWLTLSGWLASLASGAFLTGGLIQGLLILTQPNYVPQNWHVTLLYWAIILICVFVNVAAGWLLPKFEGALLVLHVLGFFAILIPLLVLGPKGDAHEIFTTFVNLGGWDSQGLSFCIGIMGSVFAFVGGDGPIHMAEEIQNAAIVIPRSIMTGICINGSLGFGMLLAILFRAGDLDVALEENPAFPFMAIFYHAVNSRAGAAVMSSIIMVLTVSANVGFAASCSRVCWAFARDKGVPGWRTLSKVSDRTSLPVNAVAATSTIACILALVNIGSTTAFNGVISVSIAGLMSSYLLISTLLLYRRLTGSLLTSNQLIEYESGSGAPNDGKLRVLWGPWRMPGIFGIINNIFACIYLTFVFFFSFWPSFADVTPMNMNWAILVTGFVAICSGVYYMVWARHTYKGPVVEVSVRYIQGGPSIDEEEHKDW